MPHILFLKPQSLVIELIPNGWADPSYRNFGIFLGKTCLFWQQTNESLSDNKVMRDGKVVNLGRFNNFAVDVEEVIHLAGPAVKLSQWWGRDIGLIVLGTNFCITNVQCHFAVQACGNVTRVSKVKPGDPN